MNATLSCWVHYFLCSRGRRWRDFAPPILGYCVCFVLWWNLNPGAKIAGSVWMLLELVYAAYRTRGFRGELANFAIPKEEE